MAAIITRVARPRWTPGKGWPPDFGVSQAMRVFPSTFFLSFLPENIFAPK
jgi:hypothetical protein